jgi:sRNA-binding protein
LYSYIFTANDENVELGFGLKAVYDAFVVQLINDGLYDPAYDAETAETPKAVQIDVAAMVADLTKPVVEEDNTTEEDATEEKTEVSNKYLPDGDIVLVTYGEPGQKFGDAGTKSLILNFNDYAIRTTLENGMTYTIEAYGYVVIYS